MSSNIFSDLLNTPFGELGKNGPQSADMTVNIFLLEKEGINGKTLLLDKRLDDESKGILNTFNSMLEKVFSPEMSESPTASLDYAKAIPKRDFSPLVSQLSKIFEIEMNNSIVQWVRECVWDIEMPGYYKKFKDGVTAIEYNIDRKPVDLNRRKNGHAELCSTIELNAMLRLIERYRERFPSELRGMSEKYIDVMDELRRDRNASSHTELIDEDRFLQFYGRFCSLVEEGWFTQIMNLKEKVCP